MKLLGQFAANSTSRRFTSVALKCKPIPHMSDDNGVLMMAIYSRSHTLSAGVSYAIIANRKGNCRRVLEAKLL